MVRVETLRIRISKSVSAWNLVAKKMAPAPVTDERPSSGKRATKSESEISRTSTAAAKRSRGTPIIFILLALTIFAAIFSLGFGRYPVPVWDIVRIIVSRVDSIPQNWPAIENTVVLQIRLPRILAALLIGGSLSIAGASFQGMFRNPLVSPDILGVTAGASVGAALAILLYEANVMIQVFAFAFGLGAVGLTYFVSKQVKGNPTLSLILAGIAIQSLFMAFVSLIKYIADPNNQLPAITYWLMGSLNAVTMGRAESGRDPYAGRDNYPVARPLENQCAGHGR